MGFKIKNFSAGECDFYLGLDEISERVCDRMFKLFLPDVTYEKNFSTENIDYTKLTNEERKNYMIKNINENLAKLDFYFKEIEKQNNKNKSYADLIDKLQERKNDLIGDRKAFED